MPVQLIKEVLNESMYYLPSNMFPLSSGKPYKLNSIVMRQNIRDWKCKYLEKSVLMVNMFLICKEDLEFKMIFAVGYEFIEETCELGVGSMSRGLEFHCQTAI